MDLFFIKQCHSKHLLKDKFQSDISSNCYGTDNTNYTVAYCLTYFKRGTENGPYLLENVGLKGWSEDTVAFLCFTALTMEREG